MTKIRIPPSRTLIQSITYSKATGSTIVSLHMSTQRIDTELSRKQKEYLQYLMMSELRVIILQDVKPSPPICSSFSIFQNCVHLKREIVNTDFRKRSHTELLKSLHELSPYWVYLSRTHLTMSEISGKMALTRLSNEGILKWLQFGLRASVSTYLKAHFHLDISGNSLLMFMALNPITYNWTFMMH